MSLWQQLVSIVMMQPAAEGCCSKFGNDVSLNWIPNTSSFLGHRIKCPNSRIPESSLMGPSVPQVRMTFEGMQLDRSGHSIQQAILNEIPDSFAFAKTAQSICVKRDICNYASWIGLGIFAQGPSNTFAEEEFITFD